MWNYLYNESYISSNSDSNSDSDSDNNKEVSFIQKKLKISTVCLFCLPDKCINWLVLNQLFVYLSIILDSYAAL